MKYISFSNSFLSKLKVSDYVMQMLLKYREWQDYQRENVGSKWIESGKVFTGVTGKPLHPSTPSKWFRSFNLKYGLKPIHLHTLRHTSATMMIMNGIPLNEISKRLGHNCASTTSNIYCHETTPIFMTYHCISIILAQYYGLLKKRFSRLTNSIFLHVT